MFVDTIEIKLIFHAITKLRMNWKRHSPLLVAIAVGVISGNYIFKPYAQYYFGYMIFNGTVLICKKSSSNTA